jgi:Methyltransferase domain
MDAELPGLRWGRRHGDVIVAWEAINRPVLARLEGGQTACTGTFAVFRGPTTTLIIHGIAPAVLDNDIAQTVADELVRPGLVRGPDAFERCFAGVVESTGPSPRAAWRRFYVNTLRAFRGDWDGRSADGPIVTFAQIYRHAEELARGRSLLDIGSCFAFFPMLLAARGKLHVTATDAHPATVALARTMAGDLGFRVAFGAADLTRRLPFATASFDTVTALHVVEHLPAECNLAALAELCRAAARRVVLAVPIERTPDAAYGHRQAFDMYRLATLANAVPGWSGTAHELLGGWLVLEPRTDRAGTVGG